MHVRQQHECEPTNPHVPPRSTLSPPFGERDRVIREANTEPSRDAERTERRNDDRHDRDDHTCPLRLVDADAERDQYTDRSDQHPQHDVACVQQPSERDRIVERLERPFRAEAQYVRRGDVRVHPRGEHERERERPVQAEQHVLPSGRQQEPRRRHQQPIGHDDARRDIRRLKRSSELQPNQRPSRVGAAASAWSGRLARFMNRT